MSVDQQLSPPAPAAESIANQDLANLALGALNGAAAVFLRDPARAEHEAALVKAIEPIARLSGGPQKLRQVRTDQKNRRGTYTLRYVCKKCIHEDGTVEVLQRPRPARDRMLAEFQTRVKAHPDQFPGGLAAFMRDANPLYTADTKTFSRLAQIRIRELLKEMPRLDASHLATELADLLDLLFAYRHSFLQNTEASPTALKIIDTGDTASMMEFLITAAAKAPLNENEFSKFLRAEAAPSQTGTSEDAILRGRIVNSGLNGTPGIMPRWITPFIRELSLRGQIPDLENKYRQRRSPSPAPVSTTPTPVPAPPTPASRESTSLPRVSAPPAPSAVVLPRPSFAGIDPNTESAIPIGATEPLRLKILKDYLEIVPVATILTLEEAMRMAIANPTVLGHHEYVLRTFRQAGWTVIPRGNREPTFEKRPHVRQPINAAAEVKEP